MTTPLSSISGLISGFNYRDLVDAIIAQARVPATRMEAEATNIKAKASALGNYRALLDSLRTAAKSLSSGTAFDATSATVSILTGTKAVAAVTTSTTSPTTSFTLKVTALAKAEKLSSTGVADASAALGASGAFTVNGQAVTVVAGDSLADLRDKINALNSGSTPSGVSATLLSVTPLDNRLILSSVATGGAGIALDDTTGTTLEGLGFLDGLGAKLLSAIVVPGADASFSLDDVPLTRTTNVISDAIDGVTITLTSDEAGASTFVEVGRYVDAARSAMKTFIESYNALVTFIKQQSTITSTQPALYGDSLLRTARAGLPQLLLQTIGGAASDLATVARAGISLTRDGTLTFDDTLFTPAFSNRFNDLRSLFTERRTSSNADLSFVSSGASAGSGTRAINVTTLATQASFSTTGFNGTYDAGGTPDTLSITDTGSGLSVDVALTTGMTTANIVDAIQAAFDSNGLNLVVATNGNDIVLTHGQYGLANGMTIAIDGAGDGASEAWSAGTTVTGTDIVGTIDGEAATGAGQTLVGDAGTSAAGITTTYSGLLTGAVGTLTLGVGAGTQIERLLDTFLTTGGGTINAKLSQFDIQSERLNSRVAALDARLERRRATLLQSFLQMETSIARLKQQSSSLLSFTSQSSNGSS